jgi:YesK-like protein
MPFDYLDIRHLVRFAGWCAIAVIAFHLLRHLIVQKKESSRDLLLKLDYPIILFLTCTTILSYIYGGWTYMSVSFIAQSIMLAIWISYVIRKRRARKRTDLAGGAGLTTDAK